MTDVSFHVPPSDSSETDHPNVEPANEITTHKHDVPNDAVPLKAGDGSPFYAPPNKDFNQIYATGASEGLLRAGQNVGHFGRFDFQREGDTFIDAYTDAYTDASNYAVGVYLAGAGCTSNEAYLIATTFAHTMSSNAGSQAQQEWWAKGWNDATNKTGPFFTSKIA